MVSAPTGFSCSYLARVHFKANLHDKICYIRLISWCIQCCLKGADPVYNSFANVAVRPEEVIHLMAYITRGASGAIVPGWQTVVER